MAFVIKNWTARQGTGLNKFTDTLTGQKLQLVNTPDAIASNGDSFTVANMNDLESRILAGLADTSPRGVYATTTALQTAYPTGTTGIFVVTADGKWYYWSGTAWLAGGVYQATAIADSSVVGNKLTSDYVTIVNLFDKDNAVAGKYVSYSTGVEQANASFCYYKIPVSSSTKYTSNPTSLGSDQFAFFDSSNVYISGALCTNNNKTFTTPSNATYCAYSITTAEKKTFIVMQGEYLPTVYYPYKVIKQVSPNSIDINSLSSDMKSSLNLFDSNHSKLGFYSSGTFVSSNDYVYYKIPVVASTKYICNFANLWADRYEFWDSNSTFITGSYALVSKRSQILTSPSSASYCVVSVAVSEKDSFMFVLGEFLPNTYRKYLALDSKFLDLPVIKKRGTIHVAKSGGDFSTINDALLNANDSADNPVTIVIHSGVYKEVVAPLGQRYISLVGVNRETCIIRYDTGIYNDAPLRIAGNCYVANLSIIATHDDNPTFVPNDSTGVTGWPAYALHVDDVNNGSGVAHFQNCYFYSNNAPALGCGLQVNQTIKFVNCEFVSNISDTFYNSCGRCRLGSLFMHPKSGGAVNQKFVVKDCIIKSNRDEVFATETSGTVNDANLSMSFYNNIFYSDTLGKSATIFKNNTPNSIITGDSFGNNLSALNP